MSSIKDVAKKAGVSVSSVSLAYHKPHQLSEKTRHKILKAAEELGYSPNLNKINNALKTIAIAVPISGIYQTQIPLVVHLTRVLFEKKYGTTILEYQSIEDLDQKLRLLKTDQYVKGLVVVYNEKEQVVLQNNELPMIVVSPHSVGNPCINVGIPYIENLFKRVKESFDQGQKKVGVVGEKKYMDLEYLQSVKEDLILLYRETVQKDYQEEEILCLLDGSQQDFDTIQSYYRTQNPDLWIFLGAYSLNIAQSVFDFPIYGFVLLEEDMICAVKPLHHLNIIRRPMGEMANKTVDKIFELISKNQKTTDEKIQIPPY
ncbi:MAG: LacI family DNA-binding transcriptional regulator [Brevinema sp.]